MSRPNANFGVSLAPHTRCIHLMNKLTSPSWAKMGVRVAGEHYNMQSSSTPLKRVHIQITMTVAT